VYSGKILNNAHLNILIDHAQELGTGLGLVLKLGLGLRLGSVKIRVSVRTVNKIFRQV